jgi:hypothetical protein
MAEIMIADGTVHADYHTAAVYTLIRVSGMRVRGVVHESSVAACYKQFNDVVGSTSSEVLPTGSTAMRDLLDSMMMSLDFYAYNSLIVLEIYQLLSSLLRQCGLHVCEEITNSGNFSIFLRLILKHGTHGDCMQEWIILLATMGKYSEELRRQMILSDVLLNILLLTNDCLAGKIRFRDSHKWYAKTLHFIESFVSSDTFHTEEVYHSRCKIIFRVNEDGSGICWADTVFQSCEILMANGYKSIALLSLCAFTHQIIDKRIVEVDSLSKRSLSLNSTDRIETFWWTALEFASEYGNRYINILIDGISHLAFITTSVKTRCFKTRFMRCVLKLTREDETLGELAYVVRLRVMSELCICDKGVCDAFVAEGGVHLMIKIVEKRFKFSSINYIGVVLGAVLQNSAATVAVKLCQRMIESGLVDTWSSVMNDDLKAGDDVDEFLICMYLEFFSAICYHGDICHVSSTTRIFMETNGIAILCGLMKSCKRSTSKYISCTLIFHCNAYHRSLLQAQCTEELLQCLLCMPELYPSDQNLVCNISNTICDIVLKRVDMIPVMARVISSNTLFSWATKFRDSSVIVDNLHNSVITLLIALENHVSTSGFDWGNMDVLSFVVRGIEKNRVFDTDMFCLAIRLSLEAREKKGVSIPVGFLSVCLFNYNFFCC